MFYIKDSYDNILRFGDVINGFQYFKPNFEKVFTVINRRMLPEQAVAPKIWNEVFSEEERTKRIVEGVKYSFAELFIYEKNDLLPFYNLSYKGKPDINTGYYMIDFKDIFTIKSAKIQRNMEYPKILQPTIETIEELRDKIEEYFKRVPHEDQIARI